MASKSGGIAAGLLALCFCFASPQSASADPSGKSYFTGVIFADILGNDCYTFNDDGTFVASFGLITGEWTEESILFLLTYYEVTIDSPDNPVFTLLDFMDGMFIAGKIETDDGDSGYFAGIESMICAIPARPAAKKTAATQEPCCGAALQAAFESPVDASRPANRRR